MAAGSLIAEGNWSSPVLPGDVQTPADYHIPAKYTDDAALSIVVQDYERASAWLNDRRYPLAWQESDLLYQSPRSLQTFEGSSVTRSNVSRFSVAKQVNSLASQISQATFYDPTPFLIRPRPSTDQDTIRAWTELISEILDDIDFVPEANTGIEGMTNQGTVIFKTGWSRETHTIEKYRRKVAPPQADMPFGPPQTIFTEDSDEFEVVEVEITKNRPIFEKCELGDVFVDPKWKSANQIWKAGFIIHRRYLNYNDLVSLRDNEDYDIPSDEVLRSIFKEESSEPTEGVDTIKESMSSNTSLHHAELPDVTTSEDPLDKPLELLEHWTRFEVKTVLQKKCIIRNGQHKLPEKPFFSANYWNIENAGYGMGVGRIAGADQRVEQGLLNALLDILAFAVQPEYAISRGANVPTQEQRRRLGGIRLVDGDAREAIALVPQPQVPADAWRAIQAVVTSSEGATGADQAAVQGSLPQRGSSIGRSGTGAGMLQAASSVRLQSPVERFCNGVFIPFLKYLYEMVRSFMPISEIRDILKARTPSLVIDFQNFFDADVKFETLAGTKLAAKNAMSQALPFLLEILGNQALVAQLGEIGWKVDILELVKMVIDASGWKNYQNLIVPMTEEEKQMKLMQNPAAIAAQAKQAETAQKNQHDMDMEDKKIQGRIVVDAVDKSHKAAIEAPLERALSFAQRTADERTMQGSQFFGAAGGG
jgi:hypothetical protein